MISNQNLCLTVTYVVWEASVLRLVPAQWASGTFIPSPCGFPHLTKNASLRVISANNSFSTINTSAYKFSALQNCGSSGKVQKVQSSFKFALEMISLPSICFQPIFDNFIKISFYSLSLERYISFLLLLWISAEGLFFMYPYNSHSAV